MNAFGIAAACVQRCDHGEGPHLTFDEAVAAVGHPLAGVKRDDLEKVVALLACQIVGLKHSQNADAKLAMTQVERIVKDYQRRSAQAVA